MATARPGDCSSGRWRRRCRWHRRSRRRPGPSKSVMLVPPSAEPWVDVDLGARPAASRTPAGQHGADLGPGRPSRPPGAGVDRAGRRTARSVPVEPGGRAENADRGDVLEHQGPGVDQAGRRRPVRCRPRACRLDQLQGQCGQVRRVGGVDDRVEGQVRQVVRGPGAGEAQRPGERQRRARCARAGAPRPLRARRTRRPAGRSCPDPSTSTRSPGRRAAARTGAQGVAARLDQGAERCRRPRRAARAARSPGRPAARPGRPGQSAPDADLEPVRADVLPPGPAPAAVPAAQHGVARDPPAEPGRVDAGADRGHRAAPLVAEPHRVTRRGPGAGRPSRR